MASYISSFWIQQIYQIMKQGSQNPIAQSQWEADLPFKWHLERGMWQTWGNYKQKSSWAKEEGLFQGQAPQH